MTKTINTQDDQTISRSVQAVRYHVPDELDNRVTQSIINASVSSSPSSVSPIFWFKFSISTAVVMALIAIFIFIVPGIETNVPQTSTNQISEIKTEFELSDKNIKVLWVQKKDFTIRRQD